MTLPHSFIIILCFHLFRLVWLANLTLGGVSKEKMSVNIIVVLVLMFSLLAIYRIMQKPSIKKIQLIQHICWLTALYIGTPVTIQTEAKRRQREWGGWVQLDGGVLLSEESAEFREWRLKHQREGSLNTAMEHNEPQHLHTHTHTHANNPRHRTKWAVTTRTLTRTAHTCRHEYKRPRTSNTQTWSQMTAHTHTHTDDVCI